MINIILRVALHCLLIKVSGKLKKEGIEKGKNGSRVSLKMKYIALLYSYFLASHWSTCDLGRDLVIPYIYVCLYIYIYICLKESKARSPAP